MRRFLQNIAIVAVVIIATTSCFKKVTTDTTLRIKLYTQEISGGELVPAEGCYGYIYYTDNTDWTVASYEDAEAKIITNTITGEKHSEPDGESEPYTMEGSVNNYISMFQDKASALVVVVYPEAQMYAYMYRKSEAENLTFTDLTLIFHTWQTKDYNEGSKDGYKWMIVVPASTENPSDGSSTNE